MTFRLSGDILSVLFEEKNIKRQHRGFFDDIFTLGSTLITWGMLAIRHALIVNRSTFYVSRRKPMNNSEFTQMFALSQQARAERITELQQVLNNPPDPAYCMAELPCGHTDEEHNQIELDEHIRIENDHELVTRIDEYLARIAAGEHVESPFGQSTPSMMAFLITPFGLIPIGSSAEEIVADILPFLDYDDLLPSLGSTFGDPTEPYNRYLQ